MPSGHSHGSAGAEGGSTDRIAVLRASVTRVRPNAAAVSRTSRSTWIGPSALIPLVSTRRTTRADFAAGRSSSTDFSPAVFGVHGTNVLSPSRTAGPAAGTGPGSGTGSGSGSGSGTGGGTATDAVTDARSAATPVNDSTAALDSCI